VRGKRKSTGGQAASGTRREFVEAMHLVAEAFRHIPTRENVDRQLSDAIAEIKHHFDIAVENIEADLKGANSDEISLLKDTLSDHGKLIKTIENHVGLWS
jgi:hypothetical protein